MWVKRNVELVVYMLQKRRFMIKGMPCRRQGYKDVIHVGGWVVTAAAPRSHCGSICISNAVFVKTEQAEGKLQDGPSAREPGFS